MPKLFDMTLFLEDQDPITVQCGVSNVQAVQQLIIADEDVRMIASDPGEPYWMIALQKSMCLGMVAKPADESLVQVGADMARMLEQPLRDLMVLPGAGAVLDSSPVLSALLGRFLDTDSLVFTASPADVAALSGAGETLAKVLDASPALTAAGPAVMPMLDPTGFQTGGEVTGPDVPALLPDDPAGFGVVHAGKAACPVCDEPLEVVDGVVSCGPCGIEVG